MRRKYWIKYRDGSIDYFWAIDHEFAYKQFVHEESHGAVDYGYAAEKNYSLLEDSDDSN